MEVTVIRSAKRRTGGSSADAGRVLGQPGIIDGLAGQRIEAVGPSVEAGNGGIDGVEVALDLAERIDVNRRHRWTGPGQFDSLGQEGRQVDLDLVVGCPSIIGCGRGVSIG